MSDDALYWKVYNKDQPPTAGKYLVVTKTMLGNTHRIDTFFNGKNWSCTNQVVTHYMNGSNK